MLELECDPTPAPGTVEMNPLQAGKDIPAPVIMLLGEDWTWQSSASTRAISL
jgi:hypothetical protein